MCEADGLRIAALLAATYGRAPRPIVLKQVARAAARWRAGEPALAQLELAFARLPRLATEADAYRLFLADQLVADRMAPKALLEALGFDEISRNTIRISRAIPRVAAPRADVGRKGSPRWRRPRSPSRRVNRVSRGRSRRPRSDG